MNPRPFVGDRSLPILWIFSVGGRVAAGISTLLIEGTDDCVLAFGARGTLDCASCFSFMYGVGDCAMRLCGSGAREMALNSS